MVKVISQTINIKAAAHVALQFGVGSVLAEGAVDMSKKTLSSECEINITVNWAGGGQLKGTEEQWTIDSVMVSTASTFRAENG